MRITINVPDTYIVALTELGCYGGGCVFRPITAKPTRVVAGMGCDCIDVDRGQANANHQNRAVKAVLRRVSEAIADDLDVTITPRTTAAGEDGGR